MSHGWRKAVVVCLHGLVWMLVLAIFVLEPTQALGQAPQQSQGQSRGQTHGLSTQRLIKLFDFEEAVQGNYEDLPQHWYVIGRPANSADPNFLNLTLHHKLVTRSGYPHFTQVRFDRPQHEQGQHSFYMKLNGGNIGAFMEVGAVPAIPMSEYQVTVRVRTEGLKHAAAQMTAYLVDSQGRQIPGSVSRSPMARTAGKWEKLSVPLRGEFTKAAWIGLELEVLQPEPDPDSPLGAQQVVLQDIQGQAWWDDVAIWQLPQISVQTQSQVNIVRGPNQPHLSVNVRDVTGHGLLANVVVYDVAGHRMDSIERMTGEGQADHWRWKPKLPGFGWYMADLSVYDTVRDGPGARPGSSHAQEQKAAMLPGAIARTLSAFLWLPEARTLDTADADKLMILGADVSDQQMKLLPEILKQSGLNAITLSLWDEQTTLATLDLRQKLLDQVMSSITTSGASVTLSLSPSPEQMLKPMDLVDANAIKLFSRPQDQWRPFLLSILMRHGQAVGRWLAGDSQSPLDLEEADLPQVIRAADRGLKGMAPNPTLLIPWSINYPRRTDVDVPVQWLLNVPWSVQAEYLGQYFSQWPKASTGQVTLTLREPPAVQMSREDRLTDLTLRMIHAWEAGPVGLALDRPWAWTSDRHEALMPDSLLGAFSQVGQYLAGRRAIGRLNLGKGLRCVIFDGPAGGMLAMWNLSAVDDNVNMYLGQAPVLRDIWGNATPLALLGGVHHLRLSRRPVFVEGIDARLALMRSAFKFDRPFIESTQTPHKRVLTLINPWRRTLTGTLNIIKPEGWRITPSQMHFSIAAGGRVQLPVKMIFPVSEVAGPKELVAMLKFQTDQAYEVNLNTPMELGLKHIHMDVSLSYQRQANGQIDAVVRQFVTNKDDKAVSLYAFTQTAGFARQEGIISRLKPGESIIRRYHFQDVTSHGDLDQPLRVGLRESRGPAVLNKLLRLKPPLATGASGTPAP